MKNLKNVLIVINDRKSQAKSIAEDLEKELKNRQIGFSTIYSTKLDDPAREEIQKPQIIFTIGGDGTFIYAARKFFGWEIPILGINAGRLGFLMEIGAEKIGSMLDDIVAEKANFMSRMMLEINVLSAGKETAVLHALNEIVISKGDLSRMIDIELYIEDNLLSRYRADGAIIATPTGSTAYNLSAGGPILLPDMDAFIATPICPHSLGVRPVVIGGSRELTLKIRSSDVETHLTADGQEHKTLQMEDRIVIRKCAQPIRMLYFGEARFFNTLREKLGWNL